MRLIIKRFMTVESFYCYGGIHAQDTSRFLELSPGQSFLVREWDGDWFNLVGGWVQLPRQSYSVARNGNPTPRKFVEAWCRSGGVGAVVSSLRHDGYRADARLVQKWADYLREKGVNLPEP